MAKARNARLILENGKEFSGRSFGFPESVAGEVVFNTAMTGYPESLTDPSYKGQILVSTYPLIGNYGVPKREVENNMLKHFESDRIHISGLVISDYSFEYSHWNAEESLGRWLTDNKVPAIFGIDTRELTKVLREHGCMLGKIVVDDMDIDWYDPNVENLVDLVSIKEKTVYGTGKHNIMLVDCGVKFNIIRSLLRYDTTVIRVPWNYDYSNEEYDGLFISNGPGDPSICQDAVAQIKNAIEIDKPTFGICLGSQLLGLASGAETYKLKYGHRSHNQPVIEAGTNKCYITSQNHGYAVDHNKLKGDWLPYFLNLNDDTCEGIKHKSKPVFATQFHPEASGGPTDTAFLFERFIELIEKSK
ncbi:MAG: glutamine-hydrolyzing carbamoyl-phosphate synthase small subunit [Salinivirgaceae bacterium]|jgi:carbamoyl-phosphate synthase small subunit|nr:glutamine-hydrolyzing carbamoyl-phosphate synthase small subunit [Salinivirgaceae bacterium]